MKNPNDSLSGTQLLSPQRPTEGIDLRNGSAKMRKKIDLGVDGNGDSLRHSEELIRQSSSLFDLVNDAIIARSLDGTIAQLNPAAERMFGYAASEIVGQPMQMLFPSGEEIEPDREPEASGAPFETVCLRKDGRPLEVSVTIAPVKSETGKVIGFSKILRDLTEFNRFKRQIEEQTSLLNKTKDAIIISDLEGRIVFWNKGAERIYGWPMQDAINRRLDEFIYADGQKFREINRATIEKGEWTGELRHVGRERQELILETRWSLLRDKDGQPKSVLVLNTDVTEIRKIEVQFMRAQRMESLGILAGGIAHDLNNILTPIMLSIEMLKGMAGGDAHIKSILETIEMSTRRGSDIVQQVLSFARGMEGQRIVIQPKYLLKDIEHIINDTFPKDIRLNLNIPHDTWTIIGDQTQVQQVLLNLCVNARDAMPNGGSLSISAENILADEHYVAMNRQAKTGSYVAISVSDVGCGISPDIIDNIFEPFFTTKDVGKGTGLGLSSVKAIVKNHDGFINLYSELGRGTTFKVYLPAQSASVEDVEEDFEEPILPRGKGETILVVDDEESILTITSETLQTYGYNVITASNGAEAVAIYAQHKKKIALILTDISMPVMDGRATIYALLKINPKAKIVAMSGMDESESVAKASTAGIKHFISKPYSAGILLKTLRTVVDA